jgi:ubiquinone/menaquinone biosynthesis C-methylase UbiE
MPRTYEAEGAAQRYDAARALPVETTSLWMRTLVSALPTGLAPALVIDLGAGTGRFAEALQKSLACAVVAIEPVAAMVGEGRRRALGSVRWCRGTAEAMPLRAGCADLVWMSQVFHHLDDTEAAVAALRRVLKPGGCVAVRNGTTENNRQIEWLQAFPEAARIDAGRLPSQRSLLATFTRHGFAALAARTVYQRFAASHREYYAKIARRGLSSLIAISDQEFAAGLERLRAWTDRQPADQPVYEPVDLFVWRAQE